MIISNTMVQKKSCTRSISPRVGGHGSPLRSTSIQDPIAIGATGEKAALGPAAWSKRLPLATTGKRLPSTSTRSYCDWSYGRESCFRPRSLEQTPSTCNHRQTLTINQYNLRDQSIWHQVRET